ncbi:MAG: hypothetical protein MRY49_02530 [Candidatus Pacebacteria bacterium]|nr:hypothetical protein [Candidatus Paceibacterota bacterium]
MRSLKVIGLYFWVVFTITISVHYLFLLTGFDTLQKIPMKGLSGEFIINHRQFDVFWYPFIAIFAGAFHCYRRKSPVIFPKDLVSFQAFFAGLLALVLSVIVELMSFLTFCLLGFILSATVSAVTTVLNSHDDSRTSLSVRRQHLLFVELVFAIVFALRLGGNIGALLILVLWAGHGLSEVIFWGLFHLIKDEQAQEASIA